MGELAYTSALDTILCSFCMALEHLEWKQGSDGWVIHLLLDMVVGPCKI